jgi:hypothetical protein
LAPDINTLAIEDNELCCLRNGVYNLGFLGVLNDARGRRFARWWRERLYSYCYDEPSQGLFTDQRWVDLAPAFFPFIHTVRDPGYNVSTWNLSTRTVVGDFGSGFEVRAEEVSLTGRVVREYPLRFYHFSGFDSGAQLRQLRRYGSAMPAVFLLRNWYIAECNRNGQEMYGMLPWEYGCYQNGQEITFEQRQLFRQREDIQQRFDDPFSTEEKHPSYYDWYIAQQRRAR